MENEAMLLTGQILKMFVFLAITGMVCAKVSEKLRIPDVVLFLLAGIIVGPAVLNLVSVETFPLGNQLIITFGSAFILYEGGREIKLRVLNEIKVTVALLSILGVILSTVLCGFVAHFIFHIPLIYGFLLGGVVASTDPATLVPVFRQIHIKERVSQAIISESAFNDAAGAIIVTSILAILSSGTFSLGANLSNLVVMILMGILIGAAVGIALSTLISNTRYGFLHEFAPIMSLVGVATSYVLSDAVGGSGYMATFVTGLICGNKKVFRLWVPEVDFISQSHFRETVALLMRMAIFILLGTHVDFPSLAQYWPPSLLFVAFLVFVARPLSVVLCAFLDRFVRWSPKEVAMMMWVRETGVIPAALSSLITAMQLPYASVISSAVFMTILLTLLLQTPTTGFVAGKLGLLEDPRRKVVSPLGNTEDSL